MNPKPTDTRGAIRLSKARNARMRQHGKSVDKGLKAIGKVISQTLGKKLPAKSGARIQHTRKLTEPSRQPVAEAEEYIRIDLLDDNGKCVGVYEDPPGICRPCD